MIIRILVSGAGPAELTATAALLRQGHSVTLIEKAADLRAAGYAIDLHENGLEVARRLDLLAPLQRVAIPLDEALYLDRFDRPLFRYDCRNMVRALKGELLVLPRDALMQVLAGQVTGEADLRFSTTLERLDQDGTGVTAGFRGGSRERFDLVIGADGLRSRVRQLALPDAPAPRDLGYAIAAWRQPSARPLQASFLGRMAVGRQAMLYRLSDGEIAALLCWRQPREDWSRDSAHQALTAAFADMPEIAGLIRETVSGRIHLDRVEQLSLPRWSQGRVVLTGDAASCGSFFSGQGTSLGMAGAWILAEELAAFRGSIATTPDLSAAFTRYEARLRPATGKMLRIGAAAARSFVPAGPTGLWLRARLAPLMMHPLLLPLTIRRTMPPRLFP